jgi:hypothetical protein
VADLQDNQATDLLARYPGVETGVTALLQQYRIDEGLDDWNDYRVHLHNLCAFFGQPKTNFVDAQFTAWEILAAT